MYPLPDFFALLPTTNYRLLLNARSAKISEAYQLLDRRHQKRSMRIHRQDIRYGMGVVTVALALIFFWPGLLKNLLVANGFIPHGHCYLWKPALVWLHFSSDLSIGLSYVAISCTLTYLVHKSRQDIPFHWVFLLFGTFIVACGSTHLMEVWTLWTPLYWLAGELKLITAVVSVTTAIVLPFLVPQVIALVEAAKISQERKEKLEIANRELEALTCRLTELNQLKSQFFANVSHELRTPLTLILGPIEQLLAADELPKEQRYPMQVVRRNAQTLLKQVNDLLDISKLEAGRMKLNYAAVDLVQLVLLSAAHFESLAREREIVFTVETPELAIGQVDAQKLQRICFNLLSNAFKFTPNGGSIRCILEVGSNGGAGEKGTIENDRFTIANFILKVEDSGPGIAPELREVIFEPFRQGDNNPNSFGSTGLGLAIVKEFVELHDGKITISDSNLGGAKFAIELPSIAPAGISLNSEVLQLPGKFSNELACQMLAELSPVLPESSTLNLNASIVLVVEDNPEMNRFITDTLGSDYCTIGAFDGREGLEKAIAIRPDLILSDVMMPQMSGDLMVREIRSRSELDNIPIILLTAKADDELRVKLLGEGVQDYLMKPFSVAELKVRVSNQIATKRAKEILQQELTSQSKDLAVLAKEVQVRQRELQTTLQAFRESEQRFRQLAENIDEVFWMYDPKTSQTLYISPAYEKIWGRSCRSLYEQLSSFLDAVHLEDTEKVKAIVAKQMSGEHTEIEYRIWQPDGSLRWIYDRSFPIYNEAGQIYRICGIAEDITQRKQVEAALQKFASELEIQVSQRTQELALTNQRLQQEIVQRQHEQEALRVSEQRFRSYFELPLIGIAITSPDKNWLQINDKLCEILGYSRPELHQMTWADITHPDDLPADLALFNRILAREIESYALDKRFICKDGEIIHTTIATQCVLRPDGSIDYFVCLVQDITDRVKAIEKLRLLESVVVNARDAVVITEAEPISRPGPKIIYVNDAFTRMTGYAREEVLGKTPRILQGPKTDRACLQKLRSALQTWQPLQVELINYRQDGSEYWVELSIVPVADRKGWYTHWIAIERDITERKQSEEERAQLIREQAARVLAEAQQKRFEFLAEASMVLASSLDYETTLARVARLLVPYLADWCVVYILKDDETICRLAFAHIDRDKEELLHQLQQMYPLDINQPLPAIEVLRTNKPVLYSEISPELLEKTAYNSEHLQLLTALKPQSALFVPLKIQGRTLGAIGFAFAESGRRYTPEDLTLAEELAARATLAVDNARTHSEAQEANRLKDEFLAVLSHELRTPLNSILGWSTLLRTRKIDAATTERALETIERNARAQTQMVSDLLDVSRIIKGKLQLNLNPVDLIPVLMAAVETLQPTAEAKGIELNCFIDPVGQVAGDSDRLQQIIWNLLSNAIKFTPSGGKVEVRLLVESRGEAREIEPNLRSRVSYARITVSDTGKGINPNFLPYVFDRFRQESGSITRSYGGLGLGLSIVRHLVELHGGVVAVDSPGEGRGATFTVKLPLLAESIPEKI